VVEPSTDCNDPNWLGLAGAGGTTTEVTGSITSVTLFRVTVRGTGGKIGSVTVLE
jgi:hypothetical protein